ncbi:MAG: hypothetical protein ACRBG0_14805 [Lewinella sp.]|uniref:hypothetical protein n=1 Tax=Lewinella sp. TaxID=2004506 RepID=UPI003D6BA7B1
MDAQKKLFAHLISRFDKKIVLHETMDILHLQKAAVYKRMSGDTALTLSEAVKLAQELGISLDTAVGTEGYHSFSHPFREVMSSFDFLQCFVDIMTPILPNEEAESRVIYLANELPVFYYLEYDSIFKFLVAIWNHLHWSQQELVINSEELLHPIITTLRNRIVAHYRSRKVTEIWNSNMLANIFQQILFAISIKAFKDQAFIAQLISDLEQLIKNLKQLAFAENRQDHPQHGKIQIYINEFGNYQNMVLFEALELRATGIGFDMPQFMISHDQVLYEYSKKWVEKIKRRSENITSGGYRFREVFFNQLEADLKLFKEKAERAMMASY